MKMFDVAVSATFPKGSATNALLNPFFIASRNILPLLG